MKVVLWFTVLLLIVGALIGLRMLQLNGAFESKPVASNVAPPAKADPYLMLPLPDPDSDVIFGSDNADTSIVRYSPREGFWAREQKVSPSIGLFNLEDGHYLFSVNGPFSDVIVAEDLEWSRPWAPASVTQLHGVAHGASFDPLHHRYFVLTEGSALVFEVHGPNFKQIGSATVNKNADWIIAEGGGHFVFTCPGLDAMSCSEFDVDSQTGALSPDGGRQIKLGAIPHRLFATPDGRSLILPEGKNGVYVPPEYRYNAQGKLNPVPGTGKEVPDSGSFWVYRLKSDGAVVPVHDSPFRSEHLPTSIALSPNGRFIYSGYRIYYGANSGEGVDVYKLNAESGELRLVPDAIPRSPGAEENPHSIIFGQSQARAYGDTRDSEVIAYDADPDTGHLTPRAKTFLSPHVSGVLSFVNLAAPTRNRRDANITVLHGTPHEKEDQ